MYSYFEEVGQWKSVLILQAMFQCKLDIYFYQIIIQFCLYLNLGVQRYFGKKKKKWSKQEKSLKQQYRIYRYFLYIVKVPSTICGYWVVIIFDVKQWQDIHPLGLKINMATWISIIALVFLEVVIQMNVVFFFFFFFDRI